MSLPDDPKLGVINPSYSAVHIPTVIFLVFFQTPPKQRHFQLLFLSGIRKIIFQFCNFPKKLRYNLLSYNRLLKE